MTEGSVPSSPYGEPSRTKRGEMVRSRAERQIADYFYENGVNYRYEDRVSATNSAFSEKVGRPDFYLPDFDLYVEYWGLVDAGDSSDRNRYHAEMEWKKKRYYESRIRFVSLYPWHLDDIDGGFKNEFKKVMKSDFSKGPLRELTVRALPLSSNFRQAIQKLGVTDRMELIELQLVYRPYFFVKYDCFAQTNFMYERFNLESRGLLVVDGLEGRVVDMSVERGTAPVLPRTGRFVECVGIQPVELPKSKIGDGVGFSSISSVAMKLRDFEAEDTAKRELARTLSMDLTRQTKHGKVYTKTPRPGIREVKISGTKLQHIPLITAAFRASDRVYKRVLQSATNRIVSDDLGYCNVEKAHYSEGLIVCPKCGRLACHEHSKHCAACKRQFCLNDLMGGGTLFKKYYCPDHSQKSKIS